MKTFFCAVGLVMLVLLRSGLAQESTNPVVVVPVPEPVLPVPSNAPPVVRKPELPSVDPGLRTLYIGEQGARLGSPRGAQDLKPHQGEKKKSTWRNELEVGATGYRGNSDSDLVLLQVRTERETEDTRLRLGARGYLGNNEGERSRENAGADLSYREQLEARTYYSADARYYYDALADPITRPSPCFRWATTRSKPTTRCLMWKSGRPTSRRRKAARPRNSWPPGCPFPWST